jgi:hypothetical protein
MVVGKLSVSNSDDRFAVFRLLKNHGVLFENF